MGKCHRYTAGHTSGDYASGQSLLLENPTAFFEHLGLNSWVGLLFCSPFMVGGGSATQKVTINYISAEWSYLSFTISSVVIAALFASLALVQYHLSTYAWLLWSLAGLLNGLGVLASFAAYAAKGKAAKATTIASALQPGFTILLAILFLNENVSRLELGGILLTIGGALSLSYEKK